MSAAAQVSCCSIPTRTAGHTLVAATPPYEVPQVHPTRENCEKVVLTVSLNRLGKDKESLDLSQRFSHR